MTRCLHSLSIVIVSLMAITVFASPIHGATQPDDKYVGVYSIFSQADTLADEGKREEALKKYHEAHTALIEFRRAHPQWNPRIVSSRLADVAEKIQKLSQPVPTTLDPKQQQQNALALQMKEEVRLISAGSEPRQLLRFKPAVGDRQEFSVSITNKTVVGLGSANRVLDQGWEFQFTLLCEVTAVSEDGIIEFVTRMTDDRFHVVTNEQSATGQSLHPGPEDYKDETKGRISDRGITRLSDNSRPTSNGNDAGIPGLETALLQFPEEPVGVGAKWEVKTREKAGGQLSADSIIHEVTAISGDQIQIATTVAFDGRNPTSMSRNSVPGMRITRFIIRGSGTSSVDLRHVMPQRSVQTLTGDSTVSIPLGQGPRAQRSSANLQLQLDTDLKVKK